MEKMPAPAPKTTPIIIILIFKLIFKYRDIFIPSFIFASLLSEKNLSQERDFAIPG
jgi:hypothetical protein